ncbi:MAG: cytochrome c biogenesis protein CcdA [Victivallaceae bacterium]
MKYFLLLTTIICFVFNASAASPFKWSCERKGGKIEISVNIPPGHYLYQAQTQIELKDFTGRSLPPYSLPAAVIHDDPFSGKVKIFPSGGKAVWTFLSPDVGAYVAVINYLGCKDKTADSPELCFPPETQRIVISGEISEENPAPDVAAPMPEQLSKLLSTFKIERAASGYLSADAFESFLSEDAVSEKSIFSDKSMLMIILLILAGGLGLNLTPCVLPMVPVNLAIIGAGSQAGSKKKGFLLGAIYGAGIALAYGGLGIIAVLTGAKFGALNSQAWFNFAVAAVFIALALAMFDIFSIDFSRFGAKFSPKDSQRGRLVTAFLMGIIAALLAGACVAPVVIAVLLYSARVYSEGNPAGLLLPLLLGTGMALPWPLVGAGMTAIPKPGAWMVRVKIMFGILIAAAGLWYAYTGVTLLPSKTSAAVAEEQIPALEAALARSTSEKKQVLIDFGASWCKNCTKMESTTFKDPDVIRKLDDFIVVKFNAEKMEDKDIKPVLDYFKIIGLPTYVIISPPNAE